MPLRILLNGAKGRMGQAISAIAPHHDTTIAAAVDLGDDATLLIPSCDVIIDFSFHEATLPLVNLAARHIKPVVIGTTGHTAEEQAEITAMATKLPIVWAGNYSIGINLLFHLTATVASILSADYNPEIVEMHHRFKIDAPSGTADQLAKIVRKARKLSPDSERHGRRGAMGERPANEIGIHALRGGDVVGDHTVVFAGDGERIELIHRASDRHVFAQGALRAAHWVLKKPPGLFSMQDVLGLVG